jgi:UDP-N-acetylglucosamine 1-carboxyvinyltransferase
MNKYLIDGSFPINGKIKASGNKNAALPCIAATLLTDEEVILRNLPEIEDVMVMFEILKGLGAEVKKKGCGIWSVKIQDIKTHEIPQEHAKNIRASILFAGPVLARLGKVLLPPPGGDVMEDEGLIPIFLPLPISAPGLR